MARWKLDWQVILATALAFLVSPSNCCWAAGINLNLSSQQPAMQAGHLHNFAPTTITVGGQPVNVTSQTTLTRAEIVALEQVLHGLGQTLIIGVQGNAIGGTLSLSSTLMQHISSLVIPSGVQAFAQFAGSSSLNLSGNLSNGGALYAYSTSPQLQAISISASNITNQAGAIISTVLPIQIAGAAANLGLNLSASGNILNAGTISSAGALSLTAGGSIDNSAGATVQAAQNVNLTSSAGNFVNNGLIASNLGNINFSTGQVAQDMIINNLGGQLLATQGAINVRDVSYTGDNLTSITGGTLKASSINLFGGSGEVDVSADELQGTVNVTAGAAHVLADGATLTLGDLNVSGDPTFYNPTGDIQITGDVVVGEDLAIIASGNVYIPSGATVNQITANGSATPSSGGAGSTITIVAGANIVPASGGAPSVSVPASGIAASNITVTGPSSTGGDIDFSVAPNLQIQASTGNVTMAAFAGSASGAGGGHIIVPGSINALTAGACSPCPLNPPGMVYLIAGAQSNAPISSVSGSFVTSAITIGGIIAAEIVLATSQPSTSDGNPITFGTDGSVQSNNFLVPGSAPLPTNILMLGTSGYSAIGGIAVTAGGNIFIQQGASGSGLTNTSGGVNLNAGGNVTIASSVSTVGGPLSVVAGGNISISQGCGGSCGGIQTQGGPTVNFLEVQNGGIILFSEGEVTLGSSLNSSGQIVIVAAGNIVATNPITISTSATVSDTATVNVLAVPGSFTAVAGANFTLSPSGSIIVTGGASSSGGYIDLSQVQSIGTSAAIPQATITASEAWLSGYNYTVPTSAVGNNITIVAFSNNAGAGGTINMPASGVSTIYGSVTLIAGSPSASASIQAGSAGGGTPAIDTSGGGTGADLGYGNITLAAATPGILCAGCPTNVLTIANNGTINGLFTAGTLQNAGIIVGNLNTANDSLVQVYSAGTISAGNVSACSGCALIGGTTASAGNVSASSGWTPAAGTDITGSAVAALNAANPANVSIQTVNGGNIILGSSLTASTSVSLITNGGSISQLSNSTITTSNLTLYAVSGDVGSQNAPVLAAVPSVASSAGLNLTANTTGNLYLGITGSVNLGLSTAGSGKTFTLATTPDANGNGQIVIVGNVSVPGGTINLSSSSSTPGSGPGGGTGGVGGIQELGTTPGTLIAAVINLSDSGTSTASGAEDIGAVPNSSATISATPILTQAQSISVSTSGKALINNSAPTTTLNSSIAGALQLIASGDIQVVGGVQTAGGPLTINAQGSVSIGANLNTAGGNLAIVAGSDIVTTSAGVQISTSPSGAASGGNLTLIAGANAIPSLLATLESFAGLASSSNTPATSSAIPDEAITITGASSQGGKIDLTTGGVVQIVSSAAVGNGNGGNITLVAYAGTSASSGTINLPAPLTITSGGAGSGFNGDVLVLAGAPSASSSISNINASGGSGGNGSVTVTAATPQIVCPMCVPNPYPTFAVILGGTILPQNSPSLSGAFVGGSLTNAPLAVGSLNSSGIVQLFSLNSISVAGTVTAASGCTGCIIAGAGTLNCHSCGAPVASTDIVLGSTSSVPGNLVSFSTLPANLTVQTVAGGNITVENGMVLTGSLTLLSGGNITTNGAISAQNVSLISGGSGSNVIQQVSATGTTFISVQGSLFYYNPNGDIQITGNILAATGPITIAASGNVFIPNGATPQGIVTGWGTDTASNLTILAGANITVVPSGGIAIGAGSSTGGDIDFSAAPNFVLLTTGGNLTLAAFADGVTGVNGGHILIPGNINAAFSSESGANVSSGNITMIAGAASNSTLTNSSIVVGGMNGNTITLTTAQPVTSDGFPLIFGNNSSVVSGNSLVAGASILPTSIVLGGVIAYAALCVTAGSGISVEQVSANSSNSSVSSGAVNFVSGGDITVGLQILASSISMVATGNISILPGLSPGLYSYGNMTLAAGGSISLGSALYAPEGNIILVAGGNICIPSSGSGITISAGGLMAVAGANFMASPSGTINILPGGSNSGGSIDFSQAQSVAAGISFLSSNFLTLVAFSSAATGAGGIISLPPAITTGGGPLTVIAGSPTGATASGLSVQWSAASGSGSPGGGPLGPGGGGSSGTPAAIDTTGYSGSGAITIAAATPDIICIGCSTQTITISANGATSGLFSAGALQSGGITIGSTNTNNDVLVQVYSAGTISAGNVNACNGCALIGGTATSNVTAGTGWSTVTSTDISTCTLAALSSGLAALTAPDANIIIQTVANGNICMGAGTSLIATSSIAFITEGGDINQQAGATISTPNLTLVSTTGSVGSPLAPITVTGSVTVGTSSAGQGGTFALATSPDANGNGQIVIGGNINVPGGSLYLLSSSSNASGGGGGGTSPGGGLGPPGGGLGPPGGGGPSPGGGSSSSGGAGGIQESSSNPGTLNAASVFLIDQGSSTASGAEDIGSLASPIAIQAASLTVSTTGNLFASNTATTTNLNSSNAGALQLNVTGSLQIAGPVQTNGGSLVLTAQGSVNIGASLYTAGGNLAIIAGSDVFTSAGGLQMSTSAPFGSGGAISLIAGAASSLNSQGSIVISGPSGQGGNIDLHSGGDLQTLSSAGSGIGSGGDITLIAYSSGAGGPGGSSSYGGALILSASLTLTSGGATTSDTNGDVLLIAGAPSAPSTIGSVDTTGGFIGSGSVTFAAAAPQILCPLCASPSVTFTSGSASALTGIFVGGTLTNAAITVAGSLNSSGIIQLYSLNSVTVTGTASAAPGCSGCLIAGLGSVSINGCSSCQPVATSTDIVIGNSAGTTANLVNFSSTPSSLGVQTVAGGNITVEGGLSLPGSISLITAGFLSTHGSISGQTITLVSGGNQGGTNNFDSLTASGTIDLLIQGSVVCAALQGQSISVTATSGSFTSSQITGVNVNIASQTSILLQGATSAWGTLTLAAPAITVASGSSVSAGVLDFTGYTGPSGSSSGGSSGGPPAGSGPGSSTGSDGDSPSSGYSWTVNGVVQAGTISINPGSAQLLFSIGTSGTLSGNTTISVPASQAVTLSVSPGGLLTGFLTLQSTDISLSVASVGSASCVQGTIVSSLVGDTLSIASTTGGGGVLNGIIGVPTPPIALNNGGPVPPIPPCLGCPPSSGSVAATGGLSIDTGFGPLAALSTVSTGGAIFIVAESGNIQVLPGQTISSNSNIVLTAAQGTLTLSGGNTLASNGGTILLLANGDVTINAGSTLETFAERNGFNSAGSIVINSTGSISDQGDNNYTTTGGGVQFGAVKDIQIGSNTAISSGYGITFFSLNGQISTGSSVTLRSITGNISLITIADPGIQASGGPILIGPNNNISTGELSTLQAESDGNQEFPIVYIPGVAFESLLGIPDASSGGIGGGGGAITILGNTVTIQSSLTTVGGSINIAAATGNLVLGCPGTSLSFTANGGNIIFSAAGQVTEANGSGQLSFSATVEGVSGLSELLTTPSIPNPFQLYGAIQINSGIDSSSVLGYFENRFDGSSLATFQLQYNGSSSGLSLTNNVISNSAIAGSNVTVNDIFPGYSTANAASAQMLADLRPDSETLINTIALTGSAYVSAPSTLPFGFLGLQAAISIYGTFATDVQNMGLLQINSSNGGSVNLSGSTINLNGGAISFNAVGSAAKINLPASTFNSTDPFLSTPSNQRAIDLSTNPIDLLVFGAGLTNALVSQLENVLTLSTTNVITTNVFSGESNLSSVSSVLDFLHNSASQSGIDGIALSSVNQSLLVLPAFSLIFTPGIVTGSSSLASLISEGTSFNTTLADFSSPGSTTVIATDINPATKTPDTLALTQLSFGSDVKTLAAATAAQKDSGSAGQPGSSTATATESGAGQLAVQTNKQANLTIFTASNQVFSTGILGGIDDDSSWGSEGTVVEGPSGQNLIILDTGRLTTDTGRRAMTVATAMGDVTINPESSAVIYNQPGKGMRVLALGGGGSVDVHSRAIDGGNASLQPGEGLVVGTSEMSNQELIDINGGDVTVTGAVTKMGNNVVKHSFNRDRYINKYIIIAGIPHSLGSLGAANNRAHRRLVSHISKNTYQDQLASTKSSSLPVVHSVESALPPIVSSQEPTMPVSSLPPDKTPASPLQIMAGEGSQFARSSEGVISLSRGAIFLVPANEMKVTTPMGDVEVKQDVPVCVELDGSQLRVKAFNVPTAVWVGKEKLSVGAGRELLVTGEKLTRDLIKPADGIGRRNAKAFFLEGQKAAVLSEYSIVSELISAPYLSGLRQPTNIYTMKLRDKLVKLAAAMQYLGAGKGQYQAVPLKPVTASPSTHIGMDTQPGAIVSFSRTKTDPSISALSLRQTGMGRDSFLSSTTSQMHLSLPVVDTKKKGDNNLKAGLPTYDIWN